MIVRRINRRKARRGFTLLEVLLVVGILVALAAIALPNLIGTQEDAQKKTAKLQVSAIEKAVKLYQVQVGSFPDSGQAGIQSLITPPNPKPENWNGPYLDGNQSMVDPWGLPYNYEFPGKHNSSVRKMPDVWSNGPDKQTGTADDIGNWVSETTAQ